jgi:heme A synthase
MRRKNVQRRLLARPAGSHYLGLVLARRSPWLLTLAYTLLVILFGALVRITGSGAGCGQHWPTCHGDVTHLPANLQTWIEYTHRATSALCGLIVLFALGVTWRARGGRHLATYAAIGAVVFVGVEGILGRYLVVLELVGSDASRLRAIVMALHLVNTSLLTGALVLAAWAYGRERPRLGRGESSRLVMVGACAFVLLAISASGAVTALGDTVVPAQGGHVEALAEMSSGAHFLERLRGVHPVLATLGALVLLWSSDRFSHGAAQRLLPWTVGVQVALGVLNVVLSAPGWMQVVHLAIANVVWLVFCWAALDTLGKGEVRHE